MNFYSILLRRVWWEKCSCAPQPVLSTTVGDLPIWCRFQTVRKRRKCKFHETRKVWNALPQNLSFVATDVILDSLDETIHIQFKLLAICKISRISVSRITSIRHMSSSRIRWRNFSSRIETLRLFWRHVRCRKTVPLMRLKRFWFTDQIQMYESEIYRVILFSTDHPAPHTRKLQLIVWSVSCWNFKWRAVTQPINNFLIRW